MNFDYKSIKTEPIPIVPNQEKQIELMVIMINKQSEMLNMQSNMISKQSELIEIIHKESISSNKHSMIAITISVLSLALGIVQTVLPLLL